MGVHRPGFQLLSLSGNASPPTHADTLCLLPDQISIFVSLYAPVAGLSIILLFISNILRMRHMSVDHGRADDNYQEAYDLLPRHASDPMDLDTQHHRDQIRLRCCGFGALSWFKTTSRPARGMIRRRGFLLDLRDVAWPPLVLFVCINLLTFVW
jgi:ethanolamine phosphate phosphodiesterase